MNVSLLIFSQPAVHPRNVTVQQSKYVLYRLNYQKHAAAAMTLSVFSSRS
ncbi:hypothetical protein CGLO_12779 [Colletotrichum gloeosporioides Cg-14]|uniref:Uncharacterized protein n=1 Tax=Colletotrichum gloeosporioides (strain Cg-14) TaxID=1237896 RepID=T0K7Q2_COLGC|nr:hypothetical protein CGLO_12779 [Colletotrichum gloeosporioides Cg-14]